MTVGPVVIVGAGHAGFQLGMSLRQNGFAERIVLLIIAGLTQTFWVMSAALILLTILSFFTAFQRMAHVWRLTRDAGLDS